MSLMVAALVRAEHFEDAAAAALRAMLQLSQEALSSSSYREQGRFLRAMFHLRPGDGYRRLWSLEQESEGVGEIDPAPLLASATAWRSVVKLRCPISIDVNLGTLRSFPPGGTPLTQSQRGELGDTTPSDESRQRLLGRQATHVCAFPLRAFGGSIEGMISLEASCPPAVGREFIWHSCAEQLQALADMAAPYLLHLPIRPIQSQKVDEFLPVMGSIMAGLLPVLRIFAQQEETLLITGPTGAGKSRLARWCHEQSARQYGPFEVLDLVTVPEELQMAELFGWKKGSFTGAVRDTLGSISRAAGGTLFIDEIDKLSLRAQAGLLHVLEERRYRPLGEASGEQRADVRFIIGTNANLEQAVQAGRFREDLFYRINVLPVRVPPLDERRDEIASWARYMANRRHRERAPEGEASLSPEAAHALSTRPWPGNLRQLDNVIRRAYTLALLEQGHASMHVLLQEKHISQALDYEGSRNPRGLLDTLLAAATAFVNEAEQRRDAPLDLDLADAFRGLVLGVAAQRIGRDKAFYLFNRENIVKSRNQVRLLRRELERVDTLYKALGRPEGSPFFELMGPEKEK